MPVETLNADQIEFLVDAARKASEDSPDPSTKNGAVAAIVADGTCEIILEAYNDLPEGLRHVDLTLVDRETRLMLTEHAERALVQRAAEVGVSLRGAVVAMTNPPCADCARAIKNSGIQSIVIDGASLKGSLLSRWMKSLTMADLMLKKGGVSVYYAHDGALVPSDLHEKARFFHSESVLALIETEPSTESALAMA